MAILLSQRIICHTPKTSRGKNFIILTTLMLLIQQIITKYKNVHVTFVFLCSADLSIKIYIKKKTMYEFISIYIPTCNLGNKTQHQLLI